MKMRITHLGNMFYSSIGVSFKYVEAMSESMFGAEMGSSEKRKSALHCEARWWMRYVLGAQGGRWYGEISIHWWNYDRKSIYTCCKTICNLASNAWCYHRTIFSKITTPSIKLTYWIDEFVYLPKLYYYQ